PSSGASAAFGGSISVTAVTNAAGVATSPIPTANNVAGSYKVTASVTGLAPANFSLTNITSASGISIFAATSSPAESIYSSSPVELGLKFRSDINGTITGIRFYKAPGDTTTHTGSLWSTS